MDNSKAVLRNIKNDRKTVEILPHTFNSETFRGLFCYILIIQKFICYVNNNIVNVPVKELIIISGNYN